MRYGLQAFKIIRDIMNTQINEKISRHVFIKRRPGGEGCWKY